MSDFERSPHFSTPNTPVNELPFSGVGEAGCEFFFRNLIIMCSDGSSRWLPDNEIWFRWLFTHTQLHGRTEGVSTCRVTSKASLQKLTASTFRAEAHLSVRYAPYTEEKHKILSAAVYQPIPTITNGRL